ncbi:hypothetical protein [Streptomyces sp. NPDC057557]|uniref:hypothetical protein n=1 Tax=Streptomyces sp. NPDC057557 TaxID=3346167 RepID=UPI00369B22AB
MPADFPPWDRVYAFFRRWRDHVLVKEFHDRLRSRIREREGRDSARLATPIACMTVQVSLQGGGTSSSAGCASSGCTASSSPMPRTPARCSALPSDGLHSVEWHEPPPT